MKLLLIITLILIIIFIFQVLIYNCLKYHNEKILFKDYFSIDKDEFLELHKNKDVIIFSAGPTFNEIKKYLHMFTPEFYNKYCIFAIKDTAIELDKLGIKVDAFVFNTANYKYLYSTYKFKNSDKIFKIFTGIIYYNFIQDYFNKFFLYFNKYNVKKIETNVYLNFKDNSMKCIVDNKKNCLTIKNNVIKKGHIMLENAIPYSILLNPSNIYILGWDNCGKGSVNNYNYFNKEKFINDNVDKPIFNTNYDFENFENTIKFSKYLPSYLKKYYNINIYKLSDKQCVHFPLYNINKLFVS